MKRDAKLYQNFRKTHVHTAKSSMAQKKVINEKIDPIYEGKEIKVKGIYKFGMTKDPETASDVHKRPFNPQPRNKDKNLFRPCFIAPAIKVGNIHT